MTNIDNDTQCDQYTACIMAYMDGTHVTEWAAVYSALACFLFSTFITVKNDAFNKI